MSSFHFQVITLFPEMIHAAMNAGVFSQAQKKDLLTLTTINPRDFTSDVHRTVDDRPFGGGDGMIMMAEPLEKSIAEAKALRASKVVYLSPQGKPLTHEKSQELSKENGLILVCGRYGGIDQRAIQSAIDEEISIGDYVISGGELAACVLMDAVSRFIPKVLGHHESADKDSFAAGVLEQPNFTRPREYRGIAVPEILLSGDHARIQEWKELVSILVTLAKRPDLLKSTSLVPSFKKAQALWSQMDDSEKALLGLDRLKDQDFQELKA